MFAFPKVIYIHLKPSVLSSRFIPEPHEVSLRENSFIDEELSTVRDSSFVLEDNGSDHLVYPPSQMFMPQKLTIKYEKDKGSEDIASLTSGKEMKSYGGNF